MFLYRFMQVVLNQMQNQKRSSNFSALEVNGKCYVVRTSKFQRECFAPRKQKIKGNTEKNAEPRSVQRGVRLQKKFAEESNDESDEKFRGDSRDEESDEKSGEDSDEESNK